MSNDAFDTAMSEAEAPTDIAPDLGEVVADLAPGEDIGVTAPVEDAPVDAPSEDDLTWQQRYENLSSKIGEQGVELGELRKLKAEWESQFTEEPVEAPVASPIDGYTPKQITDHLAAVAEENPVDAQQQAAAFFGHALEAGNLALASRIARTADDAIDSDMADRMHELVAEARIQQQIAPIQSSYQESAAQRALNDATDALIAKHPESVNYAQQIAEVVASDADVADLLQQGRHAAAFRLAYATARELHPNLTPVVQSDVQTSNADYKQSTAVASGESRVAPPADANDAADSWAADMLKNATRSSR